jgi:hypothetical protein
MRQFFIGFLIIAALVAGGTLVASVAYQAGLSTAVTTVAATAPEGTIVTPVVPGGVPGYGYGYGPGWGWHGGPGFGIFGLLFGLFFLFLLFGLLRAAFGRGRGWGGPGGWGGRGGWGNHDNGEHPWERQARERHDAWHREQRGESGGTSSTDRPSTGASGA